MLASCYRGALGVIIVFDVTNQVSFKNIKQWMIEVEEFAANSNIPRILVSFSVLCWSIKKNRFKGFIHIKTHLQRRRPKCFNNIPKISY